jgi:hypothetical protein
MTAIAKRDMSAEAFLTWAAAQDSGRYQLIGGKFVAMAGRQLAPTERDLA